MYDDDYGFWDDHRDRSHSAPITRALRPRRAHTAAGNGVPEFSPPRSVNYVWRRVGALVAIGIVAAPVALVVRGSEAKPRVAAAAVTADASQAAEIQPPAQSTAAAADAPVVAAGAIATLPGAAVETAPASLAPAQQATATQPAAAPQTAAAPDAVATLPASAARPQVQIVAAANPRRATTAVAGTPATATPACNKYSVVAGDYWIGLAKKVNVALKQLLSVNNATVLSPLYPGRSICLPANASAPTTAAPTTTVKPASTTKPTTTTVKATSTTVKAKVTATTTAPPPTTAAPPQVSYSRAEVAQIIRDIWPDDLESQAIAIATRESNLNPAVRNYCCFGLFQIYFAANKSSLVSWGITSPNMLFDPRANAYAAYAMYLRAGGWGPWGM